MAAMASSVSAVGPLVEGWASEDITNENVQRVVIEKMRSLIQPFFTRLQLIRSGNPLGAVSMKPSGIWYANAYAGALHSLRDTEIPVNGKMIPASRLFRRFRESGLFYSVMGPNEFWENIEDPIAKAGLAIGALQMKDGVSPAEAYESFSKKLSFLDCTIVLDLAYIHTTIDILGKERFDALANSHRPLVLGRRDVDTPWWAPFIPFVRCSRIMKTPRLEDRDVPIHVGQAYYMNNMADYDEKHIHGMARGFNLLYEGDGRFLGFGLSPEGASLREIGEELLRSYNEKPMEGSILLPERVLRSENERCIQILTDGKLSSEELLRRAASGEKLTGSTPEEVVISQALARTAVAKLSLFRRSRAVIEAKKVTEKEFFERADLFCPPGAFFLILDPARFKPLR